MPHAKRDSFHPIPSAAGSIARLACTRLREAGKDVAAVASKAGLTLAKLDDPTVRIPVPVQIKILQLAAEELEDDLLGFHLARSFDLREIGLVYYIIASSEQLGDALQKAARYSGVVNEGVRVEFDRDGAAAISIHYVNVDRLSDRHQIEFWLVTLMRICREVTATRLVPVELEVRHSRTDTPSEFRAFFGRDIRFGAEADRIVLSTPIISLPIVGRDTFLNSLLRQYADEALLPRAAPGADIPADVEKMITELLPHGKANAADVARRLGMSPRTLSRKLREENTSFAEVLDTLRAALAQRYLGDRERHVSEIAWLLGYREVSSFTHAFKRWAGMTPRQFRSSGKPPAGRLLRAPAADNGG